MVWWLINVDKRAILLIKRNKKMASISISVITIKKTQSNAYCYIVVNLWWIIAPVDIWCDNFVTLSDLVEHGPFAHIHFRVVSMRTATRIAQPLWFKFYLKDAPVLYSSTSLINGLAGLQSIHARLIVLGFWQSFQTSIICCLKHVL